MRLEQVVPAESPSVPLLSVITFTSFEGVVRERVQKTGRYSERAVETLLSPYVVAVLLLRVRARVLWC